MPFTDNFTGSADDLVSGRTGWTAIGSGTDAAKINASNEVKFTGSGAKVVVHETGVTDHYAQCVAKSAFDSSSAPLAVRVTDADNMIWADCFGGTYRIFDRVSGSNTSIAAAGGPSAAGDVVKLEVSGTTATVTENGNFQCSGTTTISGGTKVGIYPYWVSADPVMDDWESTDSVEKVPYSAAQLRISIEDQWV